MASPSAAADPMHCDPRELDCAAEAASPETPRGGGPWLTAMGVGLFGYALLGKGWAYIGYPPLFIGELLLVAGLVATLWEKGWWDKPHPAFLVLLMLWGAARTIPFISAFGMDALRDAVVWGYGAFAFIVFWQITAHPQRLAWFIRRFEQLIPIFLIGLPIIWAARVLLGDAIPQWPWADVSIIEPKPGDAMVHLAGILAFWVALRQRPIGTGWLILLGICAAALGSYERAGMLAFLGAFAVCSFQRPRHRSLHRLVGIGMLGLLALAVANVRFEVPSTGAAKQREFSFEQFVANITSIAGRSNMGDLDDNRDWRLDWWKEIVDYTIRGQYRWTGKGFGVNLADDDGFQVMADHSLRNPHDVQMTFLARAGVPGLALWLAVQLSWAAAVVRAYRISGRNAEHRWAGLFLFLLAYWLAFLINASFDVFLEGPMGGIWFWSLYGLGLAAVWVHAHCPDVLRDDANPAGA